DSRGSTEASEFNYIKKQVEGVKTIATRPIIRRVNKPGPISFARGLELTITLDEINFEGSGVFLLGAVLERFFSKYVSINSFTETVVRTIERGEVMRWPARLGLRHTLSASSCRRKAPPSTFSLRCALLSAPTPT